MRHPGEFDLDRFIEAQNPHYDRILGELKNGRKESHWIWYVFPQIRGLGKSPNAEMYAISSASEAREYLTHPILGPRLRECIQIVLDVDGRSAEQIFGSLDAMKFRSSISLFRQVAEDKAVFTAALDKYFGGIPDSATIQLLFSNP